MSKRAMVGMALALALLGGCAPIEGDASESYEQTDSADAVDHTQAADELEIGESEQALTAPSFALISQHSGKAMTGGALLAGSLVTQSTLFDAKGAPNQRWVSINQNITPASKPNLCVEASSGSSGALLRLQPCNGGPLQGWRLELKLQNGIKLTRWQNLPSGLYLDTGGSTSQGSGMVVRPFNGLTTQLFSRLF